MRDQFHARSLFLRTASFPFPGDNQRGAHQVIAIFTFGTQADNVTEWQSHIPPCKAFHTLTRKISVQLSVDTTLGHTLPIRMNITLPALPCAILTVDALDASGGHQIDMEGDVHKMRLDLHGNELGLYEAPQGGKDLMNFFRGLNIQFFGFGGDMIQLVGPETVAQVEQAMRAHEGCRVQGKVQVAKVAGNFHIGVHSHSFQLLQEVFDGDARKVNVRRAFHCRVTVPSVRCSPTLDSSRRFSILVKFRFCA